MAQIRRPPSEIYAGAGSSSVWEGLDHTETSVEVALAEMNLGEISLRFQHALDHTLTTEQLREHAVHSVEAANGYIEWFYLHSHPHMILPDIPVPKSMPPEMDGDVEYVQLSGRLSRIRDHIYDVMSSDLVLRGSDA